MATINIFGFIGSEWDGTTLKQVSDQLDGITDSDVTVKISSGGGYVNEGIAIFNLLRNSKKNITVEIIGQAYSIASVIAMAGNKILIAEFADMMLHPAWTFTEGNAEDLRKTADELDIISAEIFNIYKTRDKVKDNETTLQNYFNEEKYIKAQECIDLGLCDGMIEEAQNNVRYLTRYKAVAYFDKPKTKEMSENKEAKTLLDEIKAWFTGEKAKNEAPETETPEQLKEKITALEGELATLKGEKEAKDAEVATLTTEVEALNTLKTGFEAKIKEVENLIAGEKSPENGKKPEGKEVPEFLKGESVSDKMKRLDAENRKRYNS